MDDDSADGAEARFLVLWQLQALPELGFWIVMYRVWQASADLQDAQVRTGRGLGDGVSAQVAIFE